MTIRRSLARGAILLLLGAAVSVGMVVVGYFTDFLEPRWHTGRIELESGEWERKDYGTSFLPTVGTDGPPGWIARAALRAVHQVRDPAFDRQDNLCHIFIGRVSDWTVASVGHADNSDQNDLFPNLPGSGPPQRHVEQHILLVRYGWPARCAETTRIERYDSFSNAPTGVIEAGELLLISTLQQSRSYDSAELSGYYPTRPIWSGLLINASLYGAIIGVVWMLPGCVRRAVRRRRGRCVKCGYDLRGHVGGVRGEPPAAGSEADSHPRPLSHPRTRERGVGIRCPECGWESA